MTLEGVLSNSISMGQWLDFDVLGTPLANICYTPFAIPRQKCYSPIPKYGTPEWNFSKLKNKA